jgi:enoyl-CoA hydratase
MPENVILYDKRDHIGYIKLNSPETGNRINLTMAQELAEVCSQANGDENVYLVILTGSGESFCSGGDEEQLINSSGDEGVSHIISPAEAVAAIDRPTLAVINGDAIGSGLELALACDLRMASDRSHFGLPQITMGGIPMDGGTQRLSRIVGKGQALELVLTGDIIDARAALEIGLVNKVISHDSLIQEVEAMAKNLAGKASLAMRYAKEAVNKGLDLTLEQGLRLEADLYFLLHTTSDRTEGIKSYLQKRPPKYEGK